jgi:transposase
MNKPRRHFSGTEKVPISNLCDELQLYPNQVYAWLKEFFENGHTAFDNGRKTKAVEDSQQKKIDQLEAKLTRKNEVMAELMEAHTVLKKELGEI